MTIKEEIAQLETKLQATADLKEPAAVMVAILNKYAGINSKEGELYIERLMQLAEQLNSDEYRAWGFYYKGVINRLSGNCSTALDDIQQAVVLFSSLNHKKGIAVCHSSIGNVYRTLGNYPEALSNYFDALKIKEEVGDKQGIAHSYIGIGIVHQDQGDYPEALSNFLASLKIREELGDKWGIAECYICIGMIYGSEGNYPEALSNL